MSAQSFVQFGHLCVYIRIDMKNRQFKYITMDLLNVLRWK